MIKFKLSWMFLSKLLLASLISTFSLLSHAQISIYVMQSRTKLNYSQAERFSQVLQDAQKTLNYLPYTLGISLINQDRQEDINTLKQSVLNDLHKINTTEANKLEKQLKSMHFAFRETLETDLIKIVTTPKQDPLLAQNYILSLPKRPNHFVFIDTDRETPRKIKLKADQDLKGYLSKLNHPYSDSIWIIQANQDVYQATDQWRDKPYFLSPGAIVFAGLNGLPKEYQDINTRVAHLLAFSMDL